MKRASFNFSLVNKHLKKLGKIILYLFATMLLGAFIGCGVASGNPFAIFFPTTLIHFFEFLS
ncbi:DNA-directed RNA polymerase subunit beta [Lactobacillus johnsonii]|uniref:DNA-directed RNA polymerase subunit beta n=1 Tax=Lactobacillus johnsonii TaxID=33959 RepID=UPI001FB2F46E|nr:DNA-directed RNA polymerase subunit beta [Lactobacillus johnsonii]UOC05652.1 DNA-directed RNA polymerase subunit beta [Lactobacillus johnsonii]